MDSGKQRKPTIRHSDVRRKRMNKCAGNELNLHDEKERFGIFDIPSAGNEFSLHDEKEKIWYF